MISLAEHREAIEAELKYTEQYLEDAIVKAVEAMAEVCKCRERLRKAKIKKEELEGNEQASK